MNVSEIKSNDQQLSFQHSEGIINIELDKNYNLDQEFNIVISYSGTPQKEGFSNSYFNSNIFFILSLLSDGKAIKFLLSKGSYFKL